jgi:hypothetical protein
VTISEVFIRRPIATSLLMAGIAGMGLTSDVVPMYVSRRLRGDSDSPANLHGERGLSYTKSGARRAINLQVMRQPGSNTIAVTDAVRELLPSFEAELPPSGAPDGPR